MLFRSFSEKSSPKKLPSKEVTIGRDVFPVFVRTTELGPETLASSSTSMSSPKFLTIETSDFLQTFSVLLAIVISSFVTPASFFTRAWELLILLSPNLKDPLALVNS